MLLTDAPHKDEASKFSAYFLGKSRALYAICWSEKREPDARDIES